MDLSVPIPSAGTLGRHETLQTSISALGTAHRIPLGRVVFCAAVDSMFISKVSSRNLSLRLSQLRSDRMSQTDLLPLATTLGTEDLCQTG